ncbi:receptor-type tyrosine-protein phosphatase mu-like isoform X2 [Aquarana catesbeiana]|uniref:receptor-type tyrosine-protein phosphatase mu-like isoform X2 n=1 Tax=Aquarana catesbeiana TaxID=8400 RepID=UPI003CC9FC12
MDRCKNPDGRILTMYPKKIFYNIGDTVTVNCPTGYQPNPSSVRCVKIGSSIGWNNPPQCIGVTMEDRRVTSSSISGRISCTPQCPGIWRFTVQCCAEPYNYISCKTSYDKSVTFTDLQPSTKYRIYTRLSTHWGQSPGIVEVIYIRTEDSVPGKIEIMKVPSMEDNTIRWSLSEEWGKITGFQMNISAWRDYNVSFAVDESLQFPPNVTEYKIPLQYGTNYTITLRGFTSGGAGEVTTQNIETDIGDPPLHMEKTISDVTLWLHPVLSLNGPIRSYEIIVFGGHEGNLTEECLNFKNTLYNSSWTPIRYTAAVLPAEILTSPRTFTLGDNHHYNGFHNAPLIPNHNYTVYIRVTSRWNHVEKSSCSFAGFLQKRTDGSFVIVLSLPSFGFIITMLSLKFLVLVGLAVIPLTPWMEMRNPAEKRKKKRTNISTEDVDDDKVYEVLEEAENGN